MTTHINNLHLSDDDRIPTPKRMRIEQVDADRVEYFIPGTPRVARALADRRITVGSAQYFMRHGCFSGAQELADRLITERCAPPEMVILMSYGYRHYLELAMKHIIPVLAERSGEEANVRFGHDLVGLWREFRKHSEAALPEYPDSRVTDDHVERCIKQLDEFDPDSTAFRYTDKGDDCYCLSELPRADIIQLRETMERIRIELEGREDWVRELQQMEDGDFDTDTGADWP